MKRKILLTLISFITFTPEIYAECTNEDFNDFKKISDEYKVTYEYNQETKLYDIIFYEPQPDKYVFVINNRDIPIISVCNRNAVIAKYKIRLFVGISQVYDARNNKPK